MTDWYTHWNRFPARFAERDFLRQVGKTRAGVPITEEQLDRIASTICRVLALNRDDRVLDLCCGNGILTYRLAANAASLLGVDYSTHLINVARRHHSGRTLTYLEASVLDLPLEILREPHVFTKVCMYEALQHFTAEQLPIILRQLRVLAPGAPILFGSVPLRNRLWDFYDTPERRSEYSRRVTEGTEAIGTWWELEQIADVAGMFDYRSRCLPQDPVLHTSHYRMDVLLQPAQA